MTDPAPAPPPPIFNFNAYSPAEIQEAIEKVGVKKATMAFLPSFMLAVVAGGSIGLGALARIGTREACVWDQRTGVAPMGSAGGEAASSTMRRAVKKACA